MLLGWRCACCGGTYPKGNSAKQWSTCPFECYNCDGDTFLRVEDDEPEPVKSVYESPATDDKWKWNYSMKDSYFNLESD